MEACPFTSAKRTILHKLRIATDYSPKGSVDAQIVGLIGRLNALRDYATTSSCSGRVALYCHDGAAAQPESQQQQHDAEEEEAAAAQTAESESSSKGRGRWLLVEHGVVAPAAVAAALRQAWPGATALLKVEPFILHVQARDLASAVRLLAVALRAGFRESGIVAGSSGRGKLIVAVRSTAGGMDAPLQWEGRPVVRLEAPAPAGAPGQQPLDPMFLQLVEAANARMAAVEARRARFEEEFEREFQEELGSSSNSSSSAESASAASSADADPAAPAAADAGVGAAACAQCGARFASRNQLFSRHLVKVAGGTRPVCPAPAAPAPALAAQGAHTCLGCGHSASSRNALFRHVAGCALAPPRAAPAAAAAAAAVALDAEAEAARCASRTLLQRVAGKGSRVPSAPRPAPSPLLQPIASSLLRRWGHCAVPLQGAPGAGRVVVFGGSGGEGVHGRRNDLVLVDPATGEAWELPCAQGQPAPAPRVRAALVPIAAPASADDDASVTLALLFGGHAGPASALGDVWLLRLRASAAGAAAVSAAWEQLRFEAPAAAPCARFSHTLTQLRARPSSALLLGGRDLERSLGDCWELRLAQDCRSVQAGRVEGAGLGPGQRFSHAAALVSLGGGSCSRDFVLVHGGFRSPKSTTSAPAPGVPEARPILGDLWALDCSALPACGAAVPAGGSSSLALWQEVPFDGVPPTGSGSCSGSSALLPPPSPHCPLQHAVSTPPSAALLRFSHTLTQLPPSASESDSARYLMLGGECSDPQRVAPLLLELSQTQSPPGSDSSACWLTARVHPSVPELGQVGYGAARARVSSSSSSGSGSGAQAGALAPSPLLLQHTATLSAQGDLVVVGGGGVCFAFGSTFSPSFVAPRAALLGAAASAAASAAGKAQGAAPAPLAPSPQHGAPLLALPPALAQAAKAELQALQWFDWTRKVGAVQGAGAGGSSGHGQQQQQQQQLGVPLTEEGFAQLSAGRCPPQAPALAAALADARARLLAKGHLPLFAAPPLPPSLQPQPLPQQLQPLPLRGNDGGAGAMQRAGAAVLALATSWLPAPPPPHLQPRQLQQLCTPGALPGAMPRRVEWLSDVLLLPQAAFTCSEWLALLAGGAGRARALWAALGGALRTARVARAARIDAGGTRASHLTMLLTPEPPAGAYALPPRAVGATVCSSGGGGGEGQGQGQAAGAAAAEAPLPPLPASELARLHTGSGGWVRVREGGLSYAFDASRVMFSSGNVTEKARMGALSGGAGGVVVDLFAGIGYFTLPCLVRGGAAHVHACEWNPDALACLRLNLALAGVGGDRCSVWAGDSSALAERAPALRGVADRVLLGLIPSSRCAWGTALRVLKPAGGLLHVHYNVAEEEAARFGEEDLLPSLRALAAGEAALAAHGWAFALRHCERVKSYAPRVAHYVYDVEVRATQ